MPDAVVEGKLQVPIKGKILFVRTLDGRTAVHKGHVFSIDDKGNVTVYDETREQFWGFSLSCPPVVKINEQVG